MLRGLFVFLTVLFCWGCSPEPVELAEGFLIQPGDIVISDSGTDTVYLYDSDGNLKQLLLQLDSTSEITYGLAWDSENRRVLISIDGADRISAVDALDGTVTPIAFSNINLGGNMRGVTRLTNGAVLALESNNVERFKTDGSRETDGWPVTNICNTPVDIEALSAGGFAVSCTGSDRVTTHSDDGTTLATGTSGIGGTGNAYGVVELDDGSIATVFDGSTDTMIIFSSDLSTQLATYANSAVLSAPRAVAKTLDGNILVADATYDHIVEITTSGELVRTISIQNGATWDMLVIPNF